MARLTGMICILPTAREVFAGVKEAVAVDEYLSYAKEPWHLGFAERSGRRTHSCCMGYSESQKAAGSRHQIIFLSKSLHASIN